jgi:hypothetical protein
MEEINTLNMEELLGQVPDTQKVQLVKELNKAKQKYENIEPSPSISTASPTQQATYTQAVETAKSKYNMIDEGSNTLRDYLAMSVVKGSTITDEGIQSAKDKANTQTTPTPTPTVMNTAEAKNKSHPIAIHLMAEENSINEGYIPTENMWQPYVLPFEGKFEVDVGYGVKIETYDTREEAEAIVNDRKYWMTDEAMTAKMDKHIQDNDKYITKIFGTELDKEVPKSVRMGLLAMMYQIGPGIINEKSGGNTFFKLMTKAIKEKDWNEVLVQAVDSKWYKQTTSRANRVISMMAHDVMEMNLNEGPEEVKLNKDEIILDGSIDPETGLVTTDVTDKTTTYSREMETDTLTEDQKLIADTDAKRNSFVLTPWQEEMTIKVKEQFPGVRVTSGYRDLERDVKAKTDFFRDKPLALSLKTYKSTWHPAIKLYKKALKSEELLKKLKLHGVGNSYVKKVSKQKDKALQKIRELANKSLGKHVSKDAMDVAGFTSDNKASLKKYLTQSGYKVIDEDKVLHIEYK